MFSGNVAFTLLRYVLTLASGVLVSRGYVSGGVAETVIGVIVAAGSAGYGSFTATRDAQIKAVNKMPGVAVIPEPMTDR